jgi:hypothetical protein
MHDQHAQTLGGLMQSNQEILLRKLERARKTGNHAGTKGDMAESALRRILQQHLPRRYRVSHGFVVDSKGGISLQNDIIVHDAHYCPLFQLEEEEAGACFVPAESVYAVFEAKQDLTAEYLKHAAAKAASVRKLCRTSTEIIDCGEARPPRDPHRILAGIMTLGCAWVGGLGATFDASVRRFAGEEQLDLGCVMAAGTFEWAGLPGDERMVRWPAEVALSAFFLRLLSRLQALGTVPAIDWAVYGEAIVGSPAQVFSEALAAPRA